MGSRHHRGQGATALYVSYRYHFSVIRLTRGHQDVKNSGADIAVNLTAVSSTSRGLVGDTIFAVLPNIKPIHTFVITLSFQTVCITLLHMYYRNVINQTYCRHFCLSCGLCQRISHSLRLWRCVATHPLCSVGMFTKRPSSLSSSRWGMFEFFFYWRSLTT